LRELRTGDYGWRDSDGFLFFSGRKDDIFKQRGFRVSCSEIESSTRALFGITCAALIPPQGKQPSTLFVDFENEEFDVIARLRDELEEYKLPGRWITLETMPITANGKIDRMVLKAIAHDWGHAKESSMTINAAAAREALREAVSKVLEEEVPPLLDEMSMFEELRMDSTTMLETLMELESRLGFEVNPEELDIEDFLTVGAYVKFLVDVTKRQSAPAA
jgi:acyl carrier protein